MKLFVLSLALLPSLIGSAQAADPSPSKLWDLAIRSVGCRTRMPSNLAKISHALSRAGVRNSAQARSATQAWCKLQLAGNSRYLDYCVDNYSAKLQSYLEQGGSSRPFMRDKVSLRVGPLCALNLSPRRPENGLTEQAQIDALDAVATTGRNSPHSPSERPSAASASLANAPASPSGSAPGKTSGTGNSFAPSSVATATLPGAFGNPGRKPAAAAPGSPAPAAPALAAPAPAPAAPVTSAPGIPPLLAAVPPSNDSRPVTSVTPGAPALVPFAPLPVPPAPTAEVASRPPTELPGLVETAAPASPRRTGEVSSRQDREPTNILDWVVPGTPAPGSHEPEPTGGNRVPSALLQAPLVAAASQPREPEPAAPVLSPARQEEPAAPASEATVAGPAQAEAETSSPSAPTGSGSSSAPAPAAALAPVSNLSQTTATISPTTTSAASSQIIPLAPAAPPGPVPAKQVAAKQPASNGKAPSSAGPQEDVLLLGDSLSSDPRGNIYEVVSRAGGAASRLSVAALSGARPAHFLDRQGGPGSLQEMASRFPGSPKYPSVYERIRDNASVGLASGQLRKSLGTGFSEKADSSQGRAPADTIGALTQGKKPSRVIVALGTNMLGESHEQIKAESLALLTAIRLKGGNPRIVWIGPPASNHYSVAQHEDLEKAISEAIAIADREAGGGHVAPLVNTRTGRLTSTAQLRGDGVHYQSMQTAMVLRIARESGPDVESAVQKSLEDEAAKKAAKKGRQRFSQFESPAQADPTADGDSYAAVPARI